MSFSVVIFPAEPEVGGYVGVCVEKWLAVQGRTLEDVHYNMEVVLAAQVHLDLEAGQEPLAQVPVTPVRYRKAYMKSEKALDFECLEFSFEAANDPSWAFVRGPRHYRYTDERPEEPPLPWPF